MARGEEITRSYDELNRTRSQTTTSPGGTVSETLTFDKNTNLTTLMTTGSVLTPPATPATLTVTGLQPAQATYTWPDVATETSYRLERRVDPAGAWSVIDLPANSTTYQDPALSPAKLYRLRLTALNPGGASAPRETTFTTPANPGGTHNLPATITFASAGGTNTYTLGAGVNWAASTAHPWLTANIQPAGETSTLTFTAEPNPDNATRQTTLTVTGLASGPVTVPVTQ